MNELTVGSLFSGIGGIELGLELAGGFRTAWFVENNEYCQGILKKHWPEAKIYGDITKIDFRELPKVDVLTGGFPCQDISNAGRRAGITGSRSSLWKHYLEAIRTIRPRYAIIENVAALVNRGLDTVLCDLAQIRYDAEWYNLSASAVGAPHRRERIFIIAYPAEPVSTSDDVADGDKQRCDSGSDNREERHVQNDERSTEENKQERDRRECRTWKTCQDDANPKSGNNGVNHNKRGWWAAEPDVGRVAHGVPSRLDRIKCLGNAVVPQCAEIIGRAIKKAEEATR